MNYRIIFAYLLVFLLISVGSVSSVQRIISSSNDNIYRMIRNSNGKNWEATPSNIQVAINNLDNNSGVVILPGNKTFWLSNTVIVWENIMLDMQGAVFAHPAGVNCSFIELKNNSGVKNGVIDCANHILNYDTNNSFNVSSVAIYFNASSYITSATVDNIQLDAISAEYGQGENGFEEVMYGSGYGIYLHATDIDVPQRISGVTVTNFYQRNFHTGIYIHNERSNTGTNTAHIDGNTFEHAQMFGNSYHINISRNTGATRDNCSTAYNYFNDFQLETPGAGYYGSGNITYTGLICDGVGNRFEFLWLWDWPANHRGDEPQNWFTSDSESCYLEGIGLSHNDTIIYNYLDEGTDNIVFDYYWSNCRIKRIVKNPPEMPTPPPPPTDWNISNWSYYKVITIDHTKVDAVHSNFPILVVNTSSDFNLTNGRVQGNGNDFVFVTSDNATQYNHEIEKFDNSTGELVAHLNMTSISNSTDDVVHLFYGNSACGSMEHIEDTWSDDYFGVWHMRNDSGTVLDSTDKADGSINGTLVYGGAEDNFVCNASGKIGYSFDLWNWYESGSGASYVLLDDISATLNNDTYSVMAWIRTRNIGVNPTNYSSRNCFVHFASTPASSMERFRLVQTHLFENEWEDFGVSSDATYNITLLDGWGDNDFFRDKNNTWVFTYTTHDFTNSLARCYFNTTHYYEQTSGLVQNDSVIDYLCFGTISGAPAEVQRNAINGSIDEIRILSVNQSREWVNTTYNTMNSPETFLAVGIQKSV